MFQTPMIDRGNEQFTAAPPSSATLCLKSLPPAFWKFGQIWNDHLGRPPDAKLGARLRDKITLAPKCTPQQTREGAIRRPSNSPRNAAQASQEREVFTISDVER
eukprot:4936889-Amphidinium_carterae.1